MPSVVGTPVGVDVGSVEDAVELPEAELVVVAEAEEEEEEPPQLPKPAWHPVPQWSTVSPHQPY